jgi:glycosyltransferase involved in cell wall biosynthesis
MKIVQVIPGSLRQGGVGALATYLGDSLKKHGHEVEIYYLTGETANHEGMRSEKGVITKRFNPIVGDPLYIPSPSLSKELANENADIIHVHNINTMLPTFLALLRDHVHGAMVLQPHYHQHGQNIARDSFFSIYKKLLRVIALQRYDIIISNSRYEKEKLLRDFPNVSGKLKLVPEEYSIEVPPDVIWNPSDKPIRILYVGALVKYKNVDAVLHAFKALTIEQPETELVIVGAGAEADQLVALASKLQISDKITMKKELAQDELWQEYASASVVILLSSFESFSRTVHEARAIGVPIVVYNYGALSELVTNGSAEGVNTLDPNEVARVMKNVLSKKMTMRPLRGVNHEPYVNLMERIYVNVARRH